jgi:hypothetical protein
LSGAAHICQRALAGTGSDDNRVPAAIGEVCPSSAHKVDVHDAFIHISHSRAWLRAPVAEDAAAKDRRSTLQPDDPGHTLRPATGIAVADYEPAPAGKPKVLIVIVAGLAAVALRRHREQSRVAGADRLRPCTSAQLM